MKKPSHEIDRIVAHHEEPLNAKLGVNKQIPKGTQERMTREDCIELLRRVCEARPDVVVSRDWWRKNSGLADKTWTQFFGKFAEFKSAAGIKVSRRQNRLLLQTAKHSAASDLKEFNKERWGLDSKYLKPRDGRWKTLLVHFDVHDIECDRFALRVFLDVARRLGPIITDVVNGGDLYDTPEFSKYHTDPRQWDPVARFKWVQKEYWKPLRKHCPDAQFWLIEGNHELRVNALLASQTPAVKVVLSDLHGFTVPQFFGLDEFEVNYVSKADLSVVDFTQAAIRKELHRNFKVFYDAFLVHHYQDGRKKGMPGANGHHHRHIVWPHESPIFGAYSWHQYGCLHQRWASYMDGETFDNGFGLVHVDTQTRTSITEYCEIGQTQAMAAGKFYTRKEDE